MELVAARQNTPFRFRLSRNGPRSMTSLWTRKQINNGISSGRNTTGGRVSSRATAPECCRDANQESESKHVQWPARGAPIIKLSRVYLSQLPTERSLN